MKEEKSNAPFQALQLLLNLMKWRYGARNLVIDGDSKKKKIAVEFVCYHQKDLGFNVGN